MRPTIVAITALLFLVGCGEDREKPKTYTLTEAQMVALQNAAVGMSVAAKLLAMDGAGIVRLVIGADGFTSGALANVPELPAAEFTAEELAQNVAARQAYQKRGAEIKANPPSGAEVTFWATVGGLGIAALGFALKYGRNLPGIAGSLTMVMEAGLAFAPQKFKDRLYAGEKKATTALRRAVEYGHAVEAVASLDPIAREKLVEIKDEARAKARELGVDGIIVQVLNDVRKPTDA